MATLSPSNFSSNSLSGTLIVRNGYANVSLTATPYALEGDKSFTIKIRRNSTVGEVIYTLPTQTLKDNSEFVSLTANISSVNEGNLVQFTLVTANAVNNSNIYYSVFPATANITTQDFVGANVGRATIINNQATFALMANADLSLMDETGENFKVQLRTNSSTGNIIYTTSNVQILDVSKGFNIISFVENSSTVAEGGTLTLTFTATNIPTGTVFHYSTNGNATVSTFTGGNTGSFVMNGLSNTVTLLPTSVPYSTTQNFNVVLRSFSNTGAVVATSNNLIVEDSALISYISAEGGNVTTSNGYRIHTFTTSGNLTVSALGSAPSNFLDYLVVAGGGGATTYSGAGAGGFRQGSGLSVIQGTYTVIVGAGGSGTNQPVGSYGSDSTFSTITSTGGGRGVAGGNGGVGGDGGSGGGGYGGLSPGTAGGSGNTPSTSPPQGNPGGRGLTDNINYTASGGGGGAGAVGGNATQVGLNGNGGNGGSGAESSITGTSIYYAGGGGGRTNQGTSGSGGIGGGGPALNSGVGTPGTINTGGGGGGGGASPGGSGGSGVVIIRYPYVPPVTISNVVTTSNAWSVGANITFTVNALNANTVTLYYSTLGNVNTTNFIGGNTGSFVANAAGGIVTLQANTNIPTNESRYFALQIRQDSTTGYISGTSANVEIFGYGTQISATGGTETVAGGYKTHVFTTTGTLNVTRITAGQPNVEYLIVAGGGGGALGTTSFGTPGAGGGAGGLLTGNVTISGQAYTITVGGGGSSAPATNVNGTSGSNSSAFGIVTVGGGGGQQQGSTPSSTTFGIPGGSGGGAAGLANPGRTFYGGNAIIGQGNPGGTITGSNPTGNSSSGGGGAGGAGADFPGFANGPRDGGIGLSIPWIPASYGVPGPAPGRWFAGGGGGSTTENVGQPGAGGAGGGGRGAMSGPQQLTAFSGNAFTGGGGGGGSNPFAAGSGGSGIIIIRYPYS